MALTSGMTAMPNYVPQPGAVMVPQTARAEQQVAAQAGRGSHDRPGGAG